MSNEVADLEEFNTKVATGNQSRPKTNHGRGGDIAEKALETSSGDRPLSQNTQMWAVYGDKNYSACEKAVAEIPPAQYVIRSSEALGVFFQRTDANLDELIHLPDSVSEEVFKEIEIFWQKEQHFRDLGFLWKRGVLMWGPPGSGKTSCLQVVAARVIEQGGIAVYVEHPTLAASGLKILRHVEPTRPILVMLEDIDSIIDTYGESTLLALMDGELQIDNVVFVATTNYPERLDKRFINRPSRFDLVKKIGMPTDIARGTYLKAKCPRLAKPEAEDELNSWIDTTDGFSVAHLKELIVSVEVFGVPVENAAKRLRTMMNSSPKSGEDGAKAGFL